MKEIKNVRILVMAAMSAALTMVATMVIKIPTPTMGYVHLGDCFVLLSGFLFGPLIGGIAAGMGSMLADILGGYVLWAPGTFVIKYITAFMAGLVFNRLSKNSKHHIAVKSAIAGVTGEIFMITGYFLYNILILSVVNTGAESVALGEAIVQSVSEIPFNVAQAITGIALSSVLIPVFARIMSRPE
jgi:uncharacterized membrane protein